MIRRRRRGRENYFLPFEVKFTVLGVNFRVGSLSAKPNPVGSQLLDISILILSDLITALADCIAVFRFCHVPVCQCLPHWQGAAEPACELRAAWPRGG
jgi:hypothetical protein